MQTAVATAWTDLESTRTMCRSCISTVKEIQDNIAMGGRSKGGGHDPAEPLLRTGLFRFRAQLLSDFTGFQTFEENLVETCKEASPTAGEASQRKLIQMAEAMQRCYLTLAHVAQRVSLGEYEEYVDCQSGDRLERTYAAFEYRQLLCYFWEEHSNALGVLGAGAMALAAGTGKARAFGAMAVVGGLAYLAHSYLTSNPSRFLSRVGVDLRALPRDVNGRLPAEIDGLLAVGSVVMALVEQSYSANLHDPSRHCVLLGAPEMQGVSPAGMGSEQRKKLRDNYRALSLAFHPDRNAGPQATQIQSLLNESMAFLEHVWTENPIPSPTTTLVVVASSTSGGPVDASVQTPNQTVDAEVPVATFEDAAAETVSNEVADTDAEAEAEAERSNMWQEVAGGDNLSEAGDVESDDEDIWTVGSASVSHVSEWEVLPGGPRVEERVAQLRELLAAKGHVSALPASSSPASELEALVAELEAVQGMDAKAEE